MNPKLKNKVFLDYETRSALSIDNGAFAYAAHPTTDILLVGYCIEDQPYVVAEMHETELLEPLFDCIRKGYAVVCHNFLFEIAITKYIAIPKYGWPKFKLGQMRCTMQQAGRSGLPLSLDGCALALGITDKLSEGKALIKLFSIPQKDGRFIEMDSRPREKEKFKEYCGVDNIVCREIVINLPEWKEEELSDVLFDLKSNLHGVPVDVEASKIIYNRVIEEQDGFAKRATELTRGVITKMTQPQRIKQWMQANVNSSIDNCQADTIVEILEGKFGEVDEVSRQILEMRQHAGKSSTGKYVRFIHSSIDGYIHGMIISFGAHTGRGISKLLNLYNLPKPTVKYESMDILVEDLRADNAIDFKYGSYLKAASTAIRGMITAPKGMKLNVSDYAAIEARIVFWLAGSKAGVKKYHDGIDLYVDMACFIYGKAYKNIDEKERWMGKQIILGAGFGLGGKGFVGSCERWGVEVDLDSAKEAIATYRDAYPEVVDLWDNLDRASLQACRSGKVTYAANGRIAFKTTRTPSGVTMLLMKLPSGRCLTYPDVRICEVVTPWGAKKKAVTYKKAKNGGFFRDSTYGGKLTENAVQAIARDIFYYGAKCAQAAGYQILFGVYDEVIGLSDIDKGSIEEFNNLLCMKPDWAEGLPLEAEGKVMKHYQKI